MMSNIETEFLAGFTYFTDKKPYMFICDILDILA